MNKITEALKSSLRLMALSISQAKLKVNNLPVIIVAMSAVMAIFQVWALFYQLSVYSRAMDTCLG